MPSEAPVKDAYNDPGASVSPIWLVFPCGWAVIAIKRETASGYRAPEPMRGRSEQEQRHHRSVMVDADNRLPGFPLP